MERERLKVPTFLEIALRGGEGHPSSFATLKSMSDRLRLG